MEADGVRVNVSPEVFLIILQDTYSPETDVLLRRLAIFDRARILALHRRFSIEHCITRRKFYQEMLDPSIYFVNFFSKRIVVRNTSIASYPQKTPRYFEIGLGNL